MERMLAAVLYGKEDLRIEEIAVPEIGPGELLLRVRVALTCGTDVKVFRRGYHARMLVPPTVFGHELAGDVVKLGEGVRGFSIGERVVAANSAPCDRCFYCQKGLQNLCEDLLFNNGAYAEYIRIPARIVEKNTYRIPDHVDYKDAALIEPLACVLRGIHETGIEAGQTVVVVGLGPIGLMFVRVLSEMGARVIAIGKRKMQLDRAEAMGASICLQHDDNEDSIVRMVKSETGGRGADAAIEAVGRPEVWELVVKLVRGGGTVNFFGGCPSGTKVGLDTHLLHYCEITCKASFHHTPQFVRAALDFISAGKIRAEQFVLQEEPLTRLLDVMRHLMSHNGHLKTAIIP